MAKWFNRANRCIHITSEGREWIIPIHIFHRAKQGEARISTLRKPIVTEFDGSMYAFTKNEWEKVEEIDLSKNEFCSNFLRFVRLDIEEKVMRCPKLARQRSLRLKLEADRAS